MMQESTNLISTQKQRVVVYGKGIKTDSQEGKTEKGRAILTKNSEAGKKDGK